MMKIKTVRFIHSIPVNDVQSRLREESNYHLIDPNSKTSRWDRWEAHVSDGNRTLILKRKDGTREIHVPIDNCVIELGAICEDCKKFLPSNAAQSKQHGFCSSSGKCKELREEEEERKAAEAEANAKLKAATEEAREKAENKKKTVAELMAEGKEKELAEAAEAIKRQRAKGRK